MFSDEYRLVTKESPRQILLEDYKLDLPIKGGWGYSLDDACIIDSDDPSINSNIPFDGVSLEYVFVEKRLYEEMIIFRRPEERLGGIRWNLDVQCLIPHAGRQFDHLAFDVTAYPEAIWDELTSRFEVIQKNFSQEEFDELEKYRISNMQSFKREYYFDITSFFGK